MASVLEAENSEIKDLLTRLLTGEDYLINQRRESFESYRPKCQYCFEILRNIYHLYSGIL